MWNKAVDKKRRTEPLRSKRMEDNWRQLDSLRKYIDILNDIIVVTGKEKKVTFINKKGAQLLGYKEKEIVGKELSDFFPEAAKEGIGKTLNALIIKKAKPAHYEQGILAKNGSLRLISWHSTLLKDVNGRITGVISSGRDITENKRAEEKERHLAGFPRFNPHPVMELDAAGNLIYANPSAIASLKKLGKGKDATCFLPSDFKEILKCLSSQKNTKFTREVWIKGKFFIETIITIPELRVARIYARDITPSKISENILKKTRDYLENLIDYANVPIIVWDSELCITRFNRAFEILTGYKAKEVLRKDLSFLFPAKTKEETLFWVRCTLWGERLESQVLPIRCKDKSVKSVIWSSATIYDDKTHEMLSVIAQGRDITQEKAAREALQKLNSELEVKIAERTAELTESYRLTEARNKILNLIGTQSSRKEFQDSLLLLLKEWCGCGAAEIRIIADEEKESPLKRRGFLSSAIIPIRNNKKTIGHIMLRDEKEGVFSFKRRKFLETLVPLIAEGIGKFNMEDKIRRDHAILEAFFKHTVTPLVFLNTQFNFIRVNEAYAKAWKRKVCDFPGRNHFELFPHAETQEIFANALRDKTPYQAFAQPFVLPDRPDWDLNYWDWTLVPVTDNKGDVEFLVFSLMDVTERKLAEESLILAQKELESAKRLSDIGVLAATVAHELRNPLGVIRTAAYNIKRKTCEPLLDNHLHNIEKKIIESDQIINNLLFYSRIKSPHYERVKIYEIINECVIAAATRFKARDVALVKKISSLKADYVDADPLQIAEIINNILNNAYDALPQENGRIEITAQKDGQGNIEMAFSDNGEGIGDDDIKKIFEPFFTTKAKGTGLGLTVSRQIVSLHGGKISAESRRNEGTTVKVTIPARRSGGLNEKETSDH